MPSNTPIFGFPYPLGSDPVRDGNDDIEDLALAVEGRLNIGYLFVQTLYFTSSGTFTKATYPWLRAIRVRCQGGGGGGGGAGATAAGSVAAGTGAGGGVYSESFLTNIAGLASSVTVTVGAGGSGGSTAGGSGSAGGTSSFGALVSANGGSLGSGVGAGDGNANIVVGSSVITTTGVGDLVIPSKWTGHAFKKVGNDPQDFRSWSGSGGDSVLGSGGLPQPASGNGISAFGYGGGGGGALNTSDQVTGRSGGAGSQGIVIVELYA